jgi:hypothetical protein
MEHHMIVETSANKFYRVCETGNPDLAHCWFGASVKKVRGQWELKTERKTAGGRRVNRAFPELVRKAGCRVVEG